MIATAARIARQILTATATRVLAATTPAPAPADPAPAKPAAKPLFTPAEIPAVAEIEAHGDLHKAAGEARRAGNRGIDRAEKTLKRLPAGVYGRVTIRWKQSTRLVADLDQIAADYARHGLGDVPMRRCAPTCVVTVAPAVELPVTSLALAAAA